MESNGEGMAGESAGRCGRGALTLVGITEGGTEYWVPVHSQRNRPIQAPRMSPHPP